MPQKAHNAASKATPPQRPVAGKSSSTDKRGGRAPARKPLPSPKAPPSPAPDVQASERNKEQRPASKQSQVLSALRSPDGVTIDAIMQATGWQQHSVRGFFAGVVRKKLGLDLTSETEARGRVYRIQQKRGGASIGKA